MRRCTLLALAVVAALIALSQAQEPVCSYRPRATEPCMHNSECVENSAWLHKVGREGH